MSAVYEYSLAWLAEYATTLPALLLQQFQRPRMLAVATAIATEIAKAEDAWQTIYRGVNLDDGVGDALDVIGSWLGVPRYGLSDDDYRLRLRVEIAVLLSNGTMPDLIGVVRAALGGFPTVAYTLSDVAHATVRVYLAGVVTTEFVSKLLGYLNRARAVGVRIVLEYSLHSDADTFTFSSTDTPEVDTARGFGDSTNPATGGYFAGAV